MYHSGNPPHYCSIPPWLIVAIYYGEAAILSWKASISEAILNLPRWYWGRDQNVRLTWRTNHRIVCAPFWCFASSLFGELISGNMNMREGKTHGLYWFSRNLTLKRHLNTLCIDHFISLFITVTIIMLCPAVCLSKSSQLLVWYLARYWSRAKQKRATTTRPERLTSRVTTTTCESAKFNK